MNPFGKDKFDIFSEKSNDFYNKFVINSVLVQGEHSNPEPMITVILTTYKRPELLRQALESALNQQNFDNYQILIADNEGVDAAVSTETSRLISNYQDKKIIYYRHEKPVDFRMDYAARLARSQWICFMHDDDILASNYLYIMSQIVKKHRKIKYLSCVHKQFYNEITSHEFQIITKPEKVVSYRVKRYPKSYTCTGYFPGWLGAFINRKAYIDIGGMPTYRTGMGDYCMVGKFANRYGIYELESDTPLYFYRIWDKQISAAGTKAWEDLYIIEYYYHEYVTKIYHKYFRDFWNRISAYRIISKCGSLNRGFRQTSIDLEEFANACNMQEDILEKGDQYKRDIMWLEIYKEIIRRFCFTIRYKGKIGKGL